ncbi:MAG TPA: YHS domain-containing protein, partial [Nannocystis exedens]|nr:YHS domain-containing protein [Nannocystis exedens]
MEHCCHHKQEVDVDSHDGSKDPVCGMTVKPESPHAYEHAGLNYRFCSAGCRSKFAADPAKYLNPKPQDPEEFAGVPHVCPMHPDERSIGPSDCKICGMALEPESASIGKTRWTCPMHPEIVEDAPGDCPLCGMALEAMTVLSLDEAEADPELVSMTRRFIVS